jgi:hypothetical protein
MITTLPMGPTSAVFRVEVLKLESILPLRDVGDHRCHNPQDHNINSIYIHISIKNQLEYKEIKTPVVRTGSVTNGVPYIKNVV